MDRTDRLLLIVVTILHILAQAYAISRLSERAPPPLPSTPVEARQVDASPGHFPLTYEESFRYTSTLYPFLPPDTVWIKRSE